MELYTHQKLFLQRKDNNRMLLVWGCGSGKTITALMWSKIKVIMKGGRVLYIVPKHLKTRWIYDINKYVINGMVITKEELRRDWNILEKFDGVVIDECHYFSNTSSAMTKALLKYLKKCNMH